jgi:hypothetical protein
MNANELLAFICYEIDLAEQRNGGREETLFISRDFIAMLKASTAEFSVNTSDIIKLFGREVKPIGGFGEVYVGFRI